MAEKENIENIKDSIKVTEVKKEEVKPEPKGIYAKLLKVMKEVNKVPKNGYNTFHKYAYATETDLTEAIRPLLAENGIAMSTTVISNERIQENSQDSKSDNYLSRVMMEFTLVDVETGEKLVSTYFGEAKDTGDKGIYKAYTGATKYFLLKTFLIATGDDDPENDSGRGNQQKPPNRQLGRVTPPQQRGNQPPPPQGNMPTPPLQQGNTPPQGNQPPPQNIQEPATKSQYALLEKRIQGLKLQDNEVISLIHAINMNANYNSLTKQEASKLITMLSDNKGVAK